MSARPHARLALALVAGAALLEPALAADRPNIVLILADDLGYGDPGCYNADSKVPTPSIDALAAAGTRFTDAHSPSSVCSPTRYAILTGRYAWRTRLQSSVLWPWDLPLLEAERTTLPELLREHGYATACIGKWHLGWNWRDADGEPVATDLTTGVQDRGRRSAAGARVDFARPIDGGPLAHGFDRYFGDDVPNFPPRTFIEDDRVTVLPTAPKPPSMFGHDGPTAPGWDLHGVMPALAERAERTIAELAEGDAPFFLYMPLTAPHTPIAVDPDFRGASNAGAYGDYVAQVDGTVGRVLAALEAAGVSDDTLVVFTSDNGSPGRDGTNMSGPIGSVIERFGHAVSGPWRGLKSDAWEGGHRVPFVVRWPGVVPAGAMSDQLLCLVDLYATIAELLDHELADDMGEDSFSMLGALRGDAEAPGRESVVHHSGNGTFAVRRGPWKLIVGNLGSGGFSRPARLDPKEGEPGGQLYDLAADPAETTNLWHERPDLVEALSAQLAEWRASGRTRAKAGVQ